MSRMDSAIVVVLLLSSLMGCAGSGRRMQREVLEARLRDVQDESFKQARALDRAEEERSLARREADLLRQELVSLGNTPLLPEHADVLLRAESLAFHSLMTGALNVDGRPGDDTLNVVLVPQDRDGEPVKLAGAIQIELINPAGDETNRVLGKWSYSPQQARDSWHKGFLASGYQFHLPILRYPQTEDVLLQAHLQSPDGREFHTVHKLKLALPDDASLTPPSSPGSPRTLLAPGPLPSPGLHESQPLRQPTEVAKPLQPQHEYPNAIGRSRINEPTDPRSIPPIRQTPSTAQEPPNLRGPAATAPLRLSRDKLEEVPFVLEIASTPNAEPRVSTSRMPVYVPPIPLTQPESTPTLTPSCGPSSLSKPPVAPPVELPANPTASPLEFVPYGRPRGFGHLPSQVQVLSNSNSDRQVQQPQSSYAETDRNNHSRPSRRELRREASGRGEYDDNSNDTIQGHPFPEDRQYPGHSRLRHRARPFPGDEG